MKKELICTICPVGCRLETEYDEKNILGVKGNECGRGLDYAEKEIFHPERIVTTTVRIVGARHAVPLLPVKTSKSVPKSLVPDVVKAASRVTVTAPIKAGDVLIPNVLGTGADLVAQSTVTAT